MSVSTVVLSAVFAALWVYGLIDQLQSDGTIMRYLVISLALIALGLYRFSWRARRK